MFSYQLVYDFGIHFSLESLAPSIFISFVTKSLMLKKVTCQRHFRASRLSDRAICKLVQPTRCPSTKGFLLTVQKTFVLPEVKGTNLGELFQGIYPPEQIFFDGPKTLLETDSELFYSAQGRSTVKQVKAKVPFSRSENQRQRGLSLSLVFFLQNHSR